LVLILLFQVQSSKVVQVVSVNKVVQPADAPYVVCGPDRSKGGFSTRGCDLSAILCEANVLRQTGISRE